MLQLLIEANVRAMLLFAAVWLLLKMVRLRDLKVEKLIWTLALLISLAMPILMTVSAVQLPSRAVPIHIVGRLEALVAAQSRSAAIEQIVLTVYGLVTALLIARFASGLWAAARLRRASQRISIRWAEPIDVRTHPRVRTPSSFGSTILLPAEWHSWSADKLRAVIAHEQAHVCAQDGYRLWILSVYCAIFWVNPCAILLRRRLTALSEMISDDAAIVATGDRLGYAAVLASIATEAQIPSVTVGMALPATLAMRLERLLENDMPITNLRRSHKVMLLTGVALAAALTACAGTAPLVLTGDQDSAVKWISGQRLENVYPKDLQKKGVQGQVVCRVTIDATGRVTRVVAVKADRSHPELAAAAVKAVKTFRFNNSFARPVIKVMAVKFALS